MKERARLIIAAVILVVGLLAVYMLLLKPRQNELNDLRTQVAAEESTSSALQLELARLKSLQENSAELEADLTAIRQLVPTTDEVANFIFLVEETAEDSGVDFVDIAPQLPKPPPEGAALAEVRVNIGAGGGFFAVQDFLRRLYDLDRALRIDILDMTGAPAPDDNGTLVTVDVTARIFFELPAGASSTPVQPEQPTVGDPGTETPAPGGEASPPPGNTEEPAT